MQGMKQYCENCEEVKGLHNNCPNLTNPNKMKNQEKSKCCDTKCCEMCHQHFKSGLVHCLGIATCPCHKSFSKEEYHMRERPDAAPQEEKKEDAHVCSQDESGLCDDCPCHIAKAPEEESVNPTKISSKLAEAPQEEKKCPNCGGETYFAKPSAITTHYAEMASIVCKNKCGYVEKVDIFSPHIAKEEEDWEKEWEKTRQAVEEILWRDYDDNYISTSEASHHIMNLFESLLVKEKEAERQRIRQEVEKLMTFTDKPPADKLGKWVQKDKVLQVLLKRN